MTRNGILLVRMGAWALLFALAACSNDATSDSPNNPSEQILRDAVLEVGGVSASAKRSEGLCALAYPHLSYMADENQISHDGYSERSHTIQNEGGTSTGEIVAYNSGRATEQDQATSCARSWRNSPEHWKLMSKSWSYACYAMLTKANRTYCIGLFANGKLN